MEVLPRHVLAVALAFLRGGPWHLPCRLVCRAFRAELPGPSSAFVDAPYDPQRPWELIQAERRTDLAAWARRLRVPWTAATLYGLAMAGDFGALAWAVQTVLPWWIARRNRACGDDPVSREHRVVLARAVVRGGPAVLAKVRTAPLAAAVLLEFGPMALMAVVQYHGGGRRRSAPAAADRFRAAWEGCLALCGGAWNFAVLKAAIAVGADAAAVRVIAEHPDFAVAVAHPRGWAECVAECGRRGDDAVEMLEFLNAGARDDGRLLPWEALRHAVRRGNLVFVAAFLAHPWSPVGFPHERTGEAARLCSLQAVLRSESPNAVAILDALWHARIPLHRQIVVVAIPAGAGLDVVRWLLAHTAGGDELATARAVVVPLAVESDRLDVLEDLCARHGVASVITPPGIGYTRAAADRGHVDILKRLCEWGCVCDAYAVELAARNGHTVIVDWATANVS
jgi:hypothetical protein